MAGKWRSGIGNKFFIVFIPLILYRIATILYSYFLEQSTCHLPKGWLITSRGHGSFMRPAGCTEGMMYLQKR